MHETETLSAPPESLLQRFTDLTSQKRNLESQLKQVSSLIGDLEPELAEWMAAEGHQSIKRASGETIYQKVQTSVTVKPESRHLALEAARSLGLDDFITLSPQKIGAWGREMLKDPGAELPHEIREHLNVFERVRVHVRSS